MQITRETKVHDLLEAYPYLLDFLADLKPEFAKLRNPVLRNTVARVASLATVAEMGEMGVDELIDAVTSEIARHEIHPGDATSTAAADPATRAARQDQLKAIIRKLHDGYSVDAVKAEFDALTAEIDAVEIAAMEQALIAEGMPVEEVQRLCDVHVTVFRDALERQPDVAGPELPAGHPVDTYRRENEALAEIVNDAALCCRGAGERRSTRSVKQPSGPSGQRSTASRCSTCTTCARRTNSSRCWSRMASRGPRR
jgi:uncharacterized protein